MRALVPIGVVAIVAVTVLLLVWTARRRETQRKDFYKLNHQLHEARSLITHIEGELETQWAANYPDIPMLRGIVREYRENTTDKEIRS